MRAVVRVVLGAEMREECVEVGVGVEVLRVEVR